jgi:transcriptional regulator with XRE-family HTH domain
MANTFGEQLREVRLKNAMTLTQMAAALNLDSGNLSKIENGKRKIDDERLMKFCKQFKMDFNQMKGEVLSDQIAEEIMTNQLTNDVLSMVEQKLKALRLKMG